jgi:predicted DNA-binding protein (MmcQ/YjbR family)
MAQLALNNRESDTTKATPFYTNFGRHPKFFNMPYNSPNANGAIWMVDNLKKVHNKIWENIKNQQDRTQKYQNGKQKEGPQLKKGDKVYLLTKNLKTQKLSKKLNHVRVRPFFIKTVKGPVNYELDLPQDTKLHPVFHVSLLEPADPNTPIQETFHFKTQEEDEFKVKEILEQDSQSYLIKWKGYPESENTWELVMNLTNCQLLLARWHQEGQGKMSETDQRTLKTLPLDPWKGRQRWHK